tara:strand:+ start:9935 stop:11074 length:1140 start_codon:yes stop_codon:yes gene_type:complete
MFTNRRISVLGGGGFIDEKAVAFDGSGDLIRIPHHANLISEPFSVVVWFKSYTDITTRGIYAKTDNEDSSNRTGYSMTLNGSSQISAVVADGTNFMTKSGATTYIENTWCHGAQVFDKDNTNEHVYFNGVLDGTKTSVPDIDTTNAVDLYLGAYYANDASGNPTTVPMIGDIGDIAYYNKALSASEIATMYNSREPYDHKNGICSGNLVSWWRMGDDPNDEVGTSVTLISDAANSGLGPELIGDPSFDNASYWTIDTNWAVSGGKATATSATNGQEILKLNLLTNDADAQRTYRVEYTISDYTSGSVRMWLGGQTLPYRSAVGTYVEFGKCAGSANFQFAGKGDGDEFIGSLSDISVREVLGNPGFSIGDPLIVSKGSY